MIKIDQVQGPVEPPRSKVKKGGLESPEYHVSTVDENQVGTFSGSPFFRA